MSKNIVVSKIRCENPNKRNKTPALNRNNLMYVATREGVDLTPSSSTGNDNSIYVRYISERPRSHGLFGNLPANEIDDLDALCSSMYQLSKHQPVFKGILSLAEEDAKLLGYDKKDKWETTLRLALPEIAAQFKIRPTELQWVAAFHQEKGHPHVHYMLWANSDRIISPYIHTSTQNRCREIFSKYIFEEERNRQVINKTMARDDIITSGKELIRTELEQLFIPGSETASITGRIDYEHLSALSKDLLTFCSNLPAGGRLAYKFLPPEQKKALNYIVEQFLAVPALKGKYIEYQNSMKDILKSYSVVGEKELRKQELADIDLKKRLGNVILKELKNFRLSPNPDQKVYAEESYKKYNSADAAVQGNVDAQYQLGKIYANPELDAFDLQKAISYFNSAAEQGNEFALYNLGTIYANENYDVYDIKSALEFYHRAIDDFNNSAAKYQLGRMYLFGNGVEKNVILGMEYLKDAAKDGNEYAAALISFYQRNQVMYVTYTISQGILNSLTNETYQNRQLQKGLSKATFSKKLRKELTKKNQIKSSEPDL